MEAFYEWFRVPYDETGINLVMFYEPYERERFIERFFTTVRLLVVCLVLSLVIGVVGVWLQGSRYRLMRHVVQGYIQFFPNTPPLDQGILATLWRWLPVMANISEIVRGAVQSIPVGQWESSESLAFSRRQTLWMIILPQCFRRMIPPWMNWYAILTRATPLCSIMGVEEASAWAQQAMTAEDSRTELLAPFYLFLLVTHEMGFARELADRIYFTDRGVIVEHGSPETFFEKAKDPGPREFLSQIL